MVLWIMFPEIVQQPNPKYSEEWIKQPSLIMEIYKNHLGLKYPLLKNRYGLRWRKLMIMHS